MNRQDRLAQRKRKPLTAQKRDKAMEHRGRLPDCSAFIVGYDALAGKWGGSLRVPPGAVFEAEASGVFGLLEKLDRMYRKHLKEAKP